MAAESIENGLRNLELFRGLDPVRLDRIAREAERIIFTDGQPIIEADEDGEAAYVVIDGKALSYPDGPDQPPQAVAVGSMLGEMAMLIEHTYAVTVVADGPVRALRIPRPTMLDLMHQDPGLAEHLSTRIATRLTRIAVELRHVDQILARAGEYPISEHGAH